MHRGLLGMTEHDRPRVAHIVPAMDIGGVEVAISRSYQYLNHSIDYRVYYVRKRGSLNCGQRHVASLVWTCLTGGWRPDIVVTSLWWSHLFGAMLRGFGATWVAFFHSCGFSGRAQRAIILRSWRRAEIRLVDSEATGEFFREQIDNVYQVIPYVFPEQAARPDWLARKYDLIWVGRHAAVKRADLVVSIMRQVANKIPDGRVCLVSSDEVPDEFADLQLGPGWNICFQSCLDGSGVRNLLANSRFFLLTSDFEGMSMATVESIFSGCVPVARLVGELKNYIGEGYELAISKDDADGVASAAQKVVERWKDSEFAAAAVKHILERIKGYSTYEQEFLLAVTRAYRGTEE
jgi:glycosyltransferase involved in cell wall biosynthesis